MVSPPCRCVGLMAQVLAAPGDARVVQLMDDMSDEVRHEVGWVSGRVLCVTRTHNRAGQT